MLPYPIGNVRPVREKELWPQFADLQQIDERLFRVHEFEEHLHDSPRSTYQCIGFRCLILD